MRKSFAEQIQEPNAAEALAWLQETNDPEHRTISGGDGSDTAWLRDEALSIVQELYGLGAVCVTAVEIEGRVERVDQQDTSTLIVELPNDGAKRLCIFAWEAGFARGTDWEPSSDTGQRYLLIRRD